MGGVSEPVSDDHYNPNLGWIISGAIVTAVFVAGALVWILFHGI